ncbi:MAG: hypothetical protein KBT58_08575 [Bizionia sp.]|nr:hypothetical protein [Bizionia sp.]
MRKIEQPMKTKFLLFFLLLNALASISQISNEEEQKIRMNNEINEVHEYEFNLKNNDSILKDIDFYDKHGKHIKDSRFNENGKLRYQYIIEYNSDGLMSKQTGYKFDKISTVLTYKYDKNENRTENFQHSPEGKLLIHQKRIYENDLNTELYNEDVKSNNYFLSYKYFYDNDKLLKKTERYNPNGEKISTSIYVNNKKENTIFIYDNKKRKRNLSLTKKYNEIGQLIELTYSKIKKRIDYKYDSDNNLIEKFIFIKDEIDSKNKYFYKKFNTNPRI